MANFIKKKRIMLIFILSLILIIASAFIITNSFKVKAKDMISDVRRQGVTGSMLDSRFINGTADFSVNLLKNSVSKGKNTIISPTSVYLALGMTANGADGNTKSQFQNVLCNGISIDEINKYNYTLSRNIAEDKDSNSACSIWYNKDYSESIKREFLQRNVNYYNSNVYKTDFSKKEAAKDINNWVSRNTKNKIKEMVKDTDNSDVMMLINTLYFNKKWQNQYDKADVISGSFTNSDGSTSRADFMHSIENEYVHDNMAEGFIKNYEGGRISFVCMLPKNNMNIDDYISSLTGSSFIKYMKSREKVNVVSSIPEIKYDYSVKLNDSLNKMGLTDAFDSGKADFRKMSDKSIFISKVLQKSYINISMSGTEAAAATVVEMKEMCAEMQPASKTISLDRPFVFAIVDNETCIPFFMGAVVSI